MPQTSKKTLEAARNYQLSPAQAPRRPWWHPVWQKLNSGCMQRCAAGTQAAFSRRTHNYDYRSRMESSPSFELVLDGCSELTVRYNCCVPVASSSRHVLHTYMAWCKFHVKARRIGRDPKGQTTELMWTQASTKHMLHICNRRNISTTPTKLFFCRKLRAGVSYSRFALVPDAVARFCSTTLAIPIL